MCVLSLVSLAASTGEYQCRLVAGCDSCESACFAVVGCGSHLAARGLTSRQADGCAGKVRGNARFARRSRSLRGALAG
jgi:hypothetical protein